MARRSPATPKGAPCWCMPLPTLNSTPSIWRSTPSGALTACRRLYYHDWLRVAAEEATHFEMLRSHLRTQGYDYGDFPAHQGLWTMCEKTQHDIVARMALVPRTMEARGLDATPLIQRKLRQVGTSDALAAATILDTILHDEVGHVAIGNHWYRWLCEREG